MKFKNSLDAFSNLAIWSMHTKYQHIWAIRLARAMGVVRKLTSHLIFGGNLYVDRRHCCRRYRHRLCPAPLPSLLTPSSVWLSLALLPVPLLPLLPLISPLLLLLLLLLLPRHIVITTSSRLPSYRAPLCWFCSSSWAYEVGQVGQPSLSLLSNKECLVQKLKRRKKRKIKENKSCEEMCL